MIPIVVGWGKKGKDLGYAGIHKCPHCKNWTHFKLYELSSQARLYFVPVAKYGTKRFLVCGLCDTAWQLEPQAAKKLLAESVALPDPRTAMRAINRSQELCLAYADDLGEFPEEGLALIRQQVMKEFGDRVGQYAFPLALSILTDDDGPE